MYFNFYGEYVVFFVVFFVNDWLENCVGIEECIFVLGMM